MHLGHPTQSKQPRAKAAHLIGIGGAGMRALASVLVARGWRVSGSDVRAEAAVELAAQRITAAVGHRAENIPADASMVIYSEAAAADNPERVHALSLGLPSYSYPEILAHLTGGKRLLAVAGTHGKSTATAMAAEILIRAGFDPTVVCGAEPLDGDSGGRHGEGELAIVEACEYREHFLHLRPSIAAILNVEPDHFDYYQSPGQLSAAFAKFADRLPAEGLVIAPAECKTALAIALACGRRTSTFGIGAEADWRAANLEHTRGRYRFDLLRRRQRLGRVILGVPGRHNVVNALAAAAMARHCGATIEQITRGLAAFRGLKRRLQPRWSLGGVTWIDDYAHHPSEVRASLAAVREMLPRRRLVCVFQPHQASRLAAFLDEFAASLHNADRIAVADVVRAREGSARSGEPTAADLAQRLRRQGCDIIDEHNPQAIAEWLRDELESGDVLVTMGAGDFDKFFHELHQRFRRDCALA